MSRNVNEIIKGLRPTRRKKVETRTAQLIAEEISLEEVRKARRLTQQKIKLNPT